MHIFISRPGYETKEIKLPPGAYKRTQNVHGLEVEGQDGTIVYIPKDVMSEFVVLLGSNNSTDEPSAEI